MNRRCEPVVDAGCRASGVSCAVTSDCCGGYCVPGATGSLACATSCVADGEACTGNGDCCDMTASCEVVYGVRLCEPAGP
jgi:hypothetical protein